jgi:hypothetical protein
MSSFRKLYDVAIRNTNSSFMKGNCSLFKPFGCVRPRPRPIAIGRGREGDSKGILYRNKLIKITK